MFQTFRNWLGLPTLTPKAVAAKPPARPAALTVVSLEDRFAPSAVAIDVPPGSDQAIESFSRPAATSYLHVGVAGSDQAIESFSRPAAGFNPSLEVAAKHREGLAILAGQDVAAKHREGLSVIAGQDVAMKWNEGPAALGAIVHEGHFTASDVNRDDPFFRDSGGQKVHPMVGTPDTRTVGSPDTRAAGIDGGYMWSPADGGYMLAPVGR